MTYPEEFFLDVSRLVVILGSKTVRVTIHEINTKTEENIRVIPE